MCNCHSNMDIRGRCCPIYYPADYKKCGERVDTAHSHLINDYETYKKLETCKTKKQKEKVIVSYLHHKLRIIPRVEKEKIIKYYWKQQEDCYCDMIGCKTCFPEPSEKEKERWKLNAIRYNMNYVIESIKSDVKLIDPLIIKLNPYKFWSGNGYLEEGVVFCEVGVDIDIDIDTDYWRVGGKYCSERNCQVKKIIIKISGCKIDISANK